MKTPQEIYYQAKIYRERGSHGSNLRTGRRLVYTASVHAEKSGVKIPE